MLNINKRISKFLYYIELDHELLKRAKSLKTNSERDVKFIRLKYSDLQISLNEYTSFINGLYGTVKNEKDVIEWFEFGRHINNKLNNKC